LRIPAEEIVHLYICDRPGQTRGVPWFHSALVSMRQTAGFTEAEVVKARGQANITGFIKSPDGDTFVDEIDSEGKSNMALRPGVVARLQPGEELQAFIPTSPGGNFDPFISAMMRSAAIAIGLSYYTFTGDYTKTSFSSVRAAILSERDNFKIIQAWLVSALYDRLYPLWLDMAVLAGALNLPGYELNSKFYCKPRFMCRGWTWVNPLQDIKASQAAVTAGMATLTQIAAESGYDIEDIFEERQKELKLAKEKGLNFDTTVADPVVAGQSSDAAAQPTSDPVQGKSILRSVDFEEEDDDEIEKVIVDRDSEMEEVIEVDNSEDEVIADLENAIADQDPEPTEVIEVDGDEIEEAIADQTSEPTEVIEVDDPELEEVIDNLENAIADQNSELEEAIEGEGDEEVIKVDDSENEDDSEDED
jgi:hypothetical protein